MQMETVFRRLLGLQAASVTKATFHPDALAMAYAVSRSARLKGARGFVLPQDSADEAALVGVVPIINLEWIQKLHRELGITSLFVTHDQVEAMTLAQRMIVMNAGRMEQFGTPEEVYARPASTFVASFIGSPPMNLLLQAPGVREDRVLGIRPEHIDIADSGWTVTVESVELLGAERLIHTRLGAESLTIRLHEDRGAPAANQTLKVRPREDRIHGFDRQTGARL